MLTGVKKAASSKDYTIPEVKVTAKHLGITINDLLTSCLSVAVKQYFLSKGDTKSDVINIIMPANIRFKHYETVEELKLENKFAGINLNVPLLETIE